MAGLAARDDQGDVGEPFTFAGMAPAGAEQSFAKVTCLSEVRVGLAQPDSSQFMFLRHFGSKEDRCACGSDVRDPLSGDVVGRSVCRRTDRKWKATQQG